MSNGICVRILVFDLLN